MSFSERRVLAQNDINNLSIPYFVFKPNIWTEVFLTGMDKIPVKDKNVVEIGVGTGIVAIDLLRRGVDKYVGLDIDQKVLAIARHNIEKKIPEFTKNVCLIQSDLLESVPFDNSCDVICGCLPQVGKPEMIELGVDDSYSRYFDINKYQSALNIYGLGLNEAALVQSKTRLKIDGSVVLVLSGRAGEEILNQMYQCNGYRSRVIFESSIPQLRETTLKTLVEAEEEGHDFFFFKDLKCKKRITVKEAESRRVKNMDSFHKIYVIEGKLN
jgi:methylase of polypeptide subunit release factors